MNVTIKAIRNAGELYKERLVIEVLKRVDVGSYAVFSTTSQDNGISSEINQSFWFPDKKVKAGDLVVLYTKEGINKTKTYPNDLTAHFFYWGLEEPIWNDPDDTAVLIEIADWESIEVGDDIAPIEEEED
jgi:hypothetical protein